MNWYSSLWLYWSYIGFFPMLLCSFLRFREPEPKKFVSRGLIDKAFCLMMLPALCYYILDTVYIILQPQNWGGCNFSYLTHHLITLAAAKQHLSILHYPSCVMLPFALHCLLLVFPSIKWLGYLYFADVLYMIWRLGQAPWKDDWKLKVIRADAVGLLVIALPLLWYFGCKNNMENVA
mmetsp:Transcript_13691/g.25827  ORF Transcript_13691/g.25827 Transcript_13691/m.25827 type:complete len:178 (-) Transcript_13691:3419-3952(-)